MLDERAHPNVLEALRYGGSEFLTWLNGDQQHEPAFAEPGDGVDCRPTAGERTRHVALRFRELRGPHALLGGPVVSHLEAENGKGCPRVTGFLRQVIETVIDQLPFGDAALPVDPIAALLPFMRLLDRRDVQRGPRNANDLAARVPRPDPARIEPQAEASKGFLDVHTFTWDAMLHGVLHCSAQRLAVDFTNRAKQLIKRYVLDGRREAEYLPD